MGLKLKEEFPLTKGRVYLNTASQGACPSSTIRVIEEYTKDFSRLLKGEGDVQTRESLEEKYASKRLNSKNLFAEIIGASADELAFLPNATAGINAVFSMIPMKKGDNIVNSNLSYPMGATVVNKQREKGVEPRFLRNVKGRVEIDAFEKAVDDNTVAVLVDQAGWFNGFLYDLKAISEIAHDHGAYLVVDATQSVGGLNWDVERENVDFLAASTYKWLTGGPSRMRVGFLYVKNEYVDSFQPSYVGCQTLKDEQYRTNRLETFDLYDYKPRKGMRRFEVFPQSEIGYVAVENSMKVLLSHGIENIERHNKKLGSMLIEGFLESGFELQTPEEEEKRLYVNVKVPNIEETRKTLYMKDIVISARVGGLRIAPHLYSKKEDVESVLEALNQITN